MMLRLVWMFALSCLGLTACSFSADDFADNSNTCAVDQDCASGTCDLDLGICVGQIEDSYEIVIEVAAPNQGIDGGARRRIFSDQLAAKASSAMDFQLPGLIPVEGNVRKGDTRIAARITFRATSNVNSLYDDHEVLTSQELLPGQADEQVDFITQLLPREYEVFLQPVNEDAAEYPPRKFVLAIKDGVKEPITFDYDSEVVSFKGRLWDGSQALEGLQVYAIERDGAAAVNSSALSAKILNRRVISTVSTSNALGVFELKFAPTPEDPEALPDFLIVVSASADGPPYPTVIIDPSRLFPEPHPTYGYEIAVPTQQTTVHYTGWVTDADDQPVKDAAVSLTAYEDSFVGAVVLTTSTDESGNFDISAPNGDYELAVSPPAGGLSGVLTRNVAVEDNPEALGLTFRLPKRVEFQGTVISLQGKTLPEVTIVAIPLEGEDPEIFGLAAKYNRSSKVQSDERGEYILPVDVGSYDLVAQSLVGSGLPWSLRKNVQVLPDIDGSDLQNNLIELQAPVIVSGVVTDDDEMVMEQVEIVAHAIINNGQDIVRTVEIGRATSGTDGVYQLLLPPSL